jgi:hypothetical protein
VLAQTLTSIEDAALFAELLSLPNDGRYPTLELAPDQRRQRTLNALISQMQALARQNPVLMIFEDAHWTDPTSLEALGRIADRIQTLRVLLIVTFRPEFQAPWIGRPYVTALTINRLTEHEIGAMIERIVVTLVRSNCGAGACAAATATVNASAVATLAPAIMPCIGFLISASMCLLPRTIRSSRRPNSLFPRRRPQSTAEATLPPMPQ